MNGKTLLIVNPIAGKGAVKQHLMSIISGLSDGGCEVTVLPTKKGSETVDRIVSYLSRGSGFDMVVACGGDGTMSMTVEGVLRSKTNTPIGYIPFGSTNDFASSLGISSVPSEAVKNILKSKPTPHDIGRFEDRHFTYIACCGAFSDTSYSTNQVMKNMLGHTAYLISAIPSLASIHPMTLSINADGETIEGKFIFCALANTTKVAGVVKLSEKKISFSDGRFELLLIRYPNDLVEAGRVAQKLLASNLRDPLIMMRHAKCCRIHSAEPIPWSLDGEDGGKSKNPTILVQKNAIQILK